MCNLRNVAFLCRSSSGLDPRGQVQSPSRQKLPSFSVFTHQHVFLYKDPPAFLTLIHIHI